MRKRFRKLVQIASLSLVVSMLGLAGCASSGDRFRTAGQYDQDQEVAKHVREALNTAPVYKYPDVNVSVYRGQVQLSGFVANDAQRREAARIAERVTGVERVENNLLLKQTPDGSAVGGATSPGGNSQE